MFRKMNIFEQKMYFLIRMTKREKIFLGPDSNRAPYFSWVIRVDVSIPLENNGEPGSNPGRSRFFLVLQLFV